MSDLNGTCRTLFDEMGVRRWAVEPGYVEPCEETNQDRGSAESIRLASPILKACARKENAKTTSNKLMKTQSVL